MKPGKSVAADKNEVIGVESTNSEGVLASGFGEFRHEGLGAGMRDGLLDARSHEVGEPIMEHHPQGTTVAGQSVVRELTDRFIALLPFSIAGAAMPDTAWHSKAPLDSSRPTIVHIPRARHPDGCDQ